jgi:hypothetical protein
MVVPAGQPQMPWEESTQVTPERQQLVPHGVEPLGQQHPLVRAEHDSPLAQQKSPHVCPPAGQPHAPVEALRQTLLGGQHVEPQTRPAGQQAPEMQLSVALGQQVVPQQIVLQGVPDTTPPHLQQGSVGTGQMVLGSEVQAAPDTQVQPPEQDVWQVPLQQARPPAQSAAVVQVAPGVAVARPEESRLAPTAPNSTPALRRSAFRRDMGVPQIRLSSSKRLPSPISTSVAARWRDATCPGA